MEMRTAGLTYMHLENWWRWAMIASINILCRATSEISRGLGIGLLLSSSTVQVERCKLRKCFVCLTGSSGQILGGLSVIRPAKAKFEKMGIRIDTNGNQLHATV